MKVLRLKSILRLQIWLSPLILLALSVLYLVRGSYAVLDFPLDDAWIHQVYARALAHLEGMAYNTGIQEAGDTSPLWVLITAPVHFFDFAGVNVVVILIKLIGVGLAGLLAREVFLLARVLYHSRWVAGLAAAFMLFAPCLMYSALSGMETLLLAWLWLFFVRSVIEGKSLKAALALSLTPVARPEAVVLLLFYLVNLFRETRVGTWRFQPRALYGMGLLIVPFALWMLFCWRVTGHFLPNTFYLKSHAFSLDSAAIGVALRIFLDNGWGGFWAFAPGLAMFLFWHLHRYGWRDAQVLILSIVSPLVFMLAVAGSRSLNASGFYWTRWQDPANLLLSLPVVLGLALLLRSGARFVQKRLKAVWALPWRLVPRTIAIMTVLIILYQPLLVALDKRDRLYTDSRAISLLNRKAGEWIAANTDVKDPVAANDAGAVRYFGGRFTLDLIGLNHAALAFKPPLRDELLEKLKVRWLVVFPSWFEEDNLIEKGQEVADFKIPTKEYTICPCPGQSQIVIYEMRK